MNVSYQELLANCFLAALLAVLLQTPSPHWFGTALSPLLPWSHVSQVTRIEEEGKKRGEVGKKRGEEEQERGVGKKRGEEGQERGGRQEERGGIQARREGRHTLARR